MHGLRRVGHLDSLVLKTPLDLEVGVLDTGEVFRVVEVVVSQNWIVANCTPGESLTRMAVRPVLGANLRLNMSYGGDGVITAKIIAYLMP